MLLSKMKFRSTQYNNIKLVLLLFPFSLKPNYCPSGPQIGQQTEAFRHDTEKKKLLAKELQKEWFFNSVVNWALTCLS